MKRVKFILYSLIMSFFIICFSSDTFALSINEIKNRNVCNELKYELAYASSDGTLTKKECYETYALAKVAMDADESENKDELVILERKNNSTEIIDAKYALVDYDHSLYDTILLYNNLSDTKAFTYIKGGNTDDAAYIGLDFSTKRIKITISGFTGWMDKYDSKGNKQYDIVPLNWVKSSLYYSVTDFAINMHIVSNIYGTGSIISYAYGSKPEMLDVGIYYSYDGIYFYSDLKTMLLDYKLGTYDNAVNKDKPYYNYYLYLSHRSKSKYSSTDINDYITNILKYTSKIENGNVVNNSSMLYNEGYSFYSAQELYGVNSILMFGVSRNESGNGRSYLSYTNNNIFGHGAVDSDPYGSASGYDSIQYAIYAHAYKWLSYGFLQPGDVSNRFNGSNLGNKGSGINVKYASDPYWGIKAASYYYQFDKTNGFQDYNFYKIGVKLNNDEIYVKKTPNGSNVSSNYYKLVLKNTPIIIVGEEKDSEDNLWYKIMSDPMLDDKLNYVGSSKSFPRITYNWDTNYVYVLASEFYVVNPDVEIGDPNIITKYEDVINPDVEVEEEIPDLEEEVEDLPSTDNPASSLESKDGNLYYFESMNFVDYKLEVSGFLAITGMNNKKEDPISHRLIFRDVNSGVEYVYSLNRWIDSIPFEMTNSDEKEKYDYSGGWFKGSLDISNLPSGDYRIYIEMSNNTYKTRSDFNNLFFKECVRKAIAENGKGFLFQMNYYEKSVPMELSVRSMGLISTNVPPTIDIMYNSYEKLEFVNNSLHIVGTSHNVGVGYQSSFNVERSIVFENVSTFARYTYNAGSITNGSYKVSLRVDDGKDKTRAWFDANLDLSNIPKGVYAIYIKTKGDGGEDYGELNDIFYTNINQTATINGKKFSLRRVDDKRFRIELVVE